MIKILQELLNALIILPLSLVPVNKMVCSFNSFYYDKVAPESFVEGSWSPVPVGNIRNHKFEAPYRDMFNWGYSDTTLVWKIERHSVMTTNWNVTTQKYEKVSSLEMPGYYTVKLLEPNTDSIYHTFMMVLFRINGVLYADFSPLTSSAIEKNRMIKEDFLKVHTIARITPDGDSFTVSWLSWDYMLYMIRNYHVRAKITITLWQQMMLTGTSKQLTEMLERYANDKRFIDWEQQSAIMKLNLIRR